MLAPLAGLAGPNVLEGLPPLIVLQTGVLLPLAVLAVYALAASIGGRALGLWAAALWVALPFVAIPLFIESYREKYLDLFLPQALGLVVLGDFPSLVCLLLAGVFVFRALDAHSLPDAALAGLLAGFALGIKPANALFLAAPALAFAVARRPRALAAFAAAVAPAVLALAVWKYRGIGQLPVLGSTAVHLAAGPVAAIGAPGGLSRYLRFDGEVFGENLRDLHDVFWSVRLLEWGLVAGVVAVGRRSLPKAAFLAAWLGAFVLGKAGAPQASVESTSFFRLLMPACAPFALLVAAIPLLVPRASGRLRPLARLRGLGWRSPGLVAGAVALALLPLVAVAAASPLRGPDAVRWPEEGLYLPVRRDLAATADERDGRVRLGWRTPGAGDTSVFFRVLRAPGDGDVSCQARAHATADCILRATVIGTTEQPRWLDRPPPGRYTYRIGLAANAHDDPRVGEVLLLGPPLRASVS